MSAKKVKLFTHNDLDGYGCRILAEKAFGKNLEVEHCANPQDANEKVIAYVDNIFNGNINVPDLILITDISVKEDGAKKLNELYAYSHTLINLLDHHPSAMWMRNTCIWASIFMEHDDENENSSEECSFNGLASGTSLLYEYLLSMGYVEYDKKTHKFVEAVRQWDTFEWKTVYNNKRKPLELNRLLYLLGEVEFTKRFLNDQSLKFSEVERILLNTEEKRIQNYFNEKESQMFVQRIDEYEVGIVFAEQYVSELGNYLAERHLNLHFIILIELGKEKVSYRGVHEDIDLMKFAQRYGGGGQFYASGSSISKQLKHSIAELIYHDKLKKQSNL